MSNQRVVVFSDLHLGPDGPLATFNDGNALASLLRTLRGDDRSSLEIVLAGDIFDFLQIPGYSGFDAFHAAERLEQILRNPQTELVVSALRHLVQRSCVDVTVLSGNHDPEMLLPDARRVFEDRIGRLGSVRWADDMPLRPRIGEDWPVWGRAVGSNEEQVWIVHGDRWDPHNAIDRDALRADVAAGRKPDLPIGSRLVYEVLQELQIADRRWIPEIKPEFGVVLPLLLYLDSKRMQQFLWSHWHLSAALLRGAVAAKMQCGELFGGLPSIEPTPSASAERVVASIAEALDVEVPGDPERALSEFEMYLSASDKHSSYGDDVLATHTGVRRALLRAWLLAVRSTSWMADANGSDGLVSGARRFLTPDVTALVAGHTHGPRDRIEGLHYVNTGTWIPVGALHDGPIATAIDEIEAGRWRAKPPRTFAVIDLTKDGPPEAGLAQADESGRWWRTNRDS